MHTGLFNSRRRSSILALGVLAAAVCPALGQATIVAPAGSFESFAYGAGGTVGVGTVRPPQGNSGAYLFRVGQPGVSLNPIAAAGQAVSGSFAYGASGNQQVGFTIVDLDIDDGQPATDQATLWTGTAASAVYLNPPGIERGIAVSTDGVNQSGAVSPNGVSLAAVWSGTAASYVSIHPTTGFDDSTAYGVHRGKAAGTGTDTDQQFFAAIYWPTLDAASAIMLRQPTELESQASGIFSPLTGPTLVFGAAYPDGQPWHATIWSIPADPAARTQADVHPAGFFNSFILEGNDRAQVGVAGVLVGDRQLSRAFYWRGSAASAVNLHTFVQASFPNLNNSVAEGIDDNGFIYGRAWQQDDLFPDGDNYVAVRWAPVVLCCRGTTCALIPGDACTAPVGVGVALNAAGPSCAATASAAAGCCYADFNKDATRNVSDIFAFLSAWFARSPYATIGGDGITEPNVGDIFGFLSAWFAGCQ